MEQGLFKRIYEEAHDYVNEHVEELNSLSEGELTCVYKGNLSSYGCAWIACNEGIEGNIYHFLDASYSKLLSIDGAQ